MEQLPGFCINQSLASMHGGSHSNDGACREESSPHRSCMGFVEERKAIWPDQSRSAIREVATGGTLVPGVSRDDARA